jgi:hypothetical protein
MTLPHLHRAGVAGAGPKGSYGARSPGFRDAATPATHRLQFRTAALAAILIAVTAADAHAQSKLPLQVEVEFPSNVSRTCGPVRLQLILTWGGPGVFRGALELEARDASNELIATYLLDNLYLNEGEQSQELMLPGYRVGGLDDAFSIRPRVISKDTGQAWQLNELQVQTPSDQQRELVIAILAPDSLQQTRRENDLTDSLRLEKLAPPDVFKPKILTKATDWRADDAPQDPLRYCACDIVLLAADGLAMLQQPKLDALLGWVRAGGGICVPIEGAELDAPQVAFLNSLVGSTESHPVFLRDSQGRLIHELDESPDQSLQRHFGLGRVVIVAGPDQSHPRAPHWPRTAAFLWRLRYEHLPTIVRDGTWNQSYTLDSARQSLKNSNTQYGTVEEAVKIQAADYQAIPTYGLTDLIMGMLPRGIRLVPLSTMCLWLAAYLVMIGPVDYFVLGWLGKRRWTWFTFPAMTLLFTAISIGVSNRAMSSTTMSRSVVLHDMTSGGAVARENRLELLFPSQSQPVTTNSSRGLLMPMRYQDFAQFNSDYMFNNPGAFQAMQGQRVQPAYFNGRMPSQCAMTQAVPQWTPQLNRSMTIPIEQPKDLPEFDWDQVPDFKTPEGQAELKRRIEAAFGLSVQDKLRFGLTDGVSAGVYHGDAVTVLLGAGSYFQMHNTEPQLINTPYGQQWNTRTDSYLRLLSVGTQPGFMGVVSGYAPTGGDRFEDLCLLDPTNPKQSLLVIVQPVGLDFHIYRRLYVLEN